MWRPRHAPPGPTAGPRLPPSGGFNTHNFSRPPPGPPAPDLQLRSGPPPPLGAGIGHSFRPPFPPPHRPAVMNRPGPNLPPPRAPFHPTVAPPGFGGGEPPPPGYGPPVPPPGVSQMPPGAGPVPTAPPPMTGSAPGPAGWWKPAAGEKPAPDSAIHGGLEIAVPAAEPGGGGDSEATATERWLATWLERSGVGRRCSEEAAERKTKKAVNLSALQSLPPADLHHPATAARLRQLVARWRRRRQAERRRRQADRRRLARRHAEIDAWQADIRRRAARQQEAEDMKREADKVLGEVRRKISDVEKHLETLEELRTLREARDLKARSAGLFSSAASDQRFAEVTSRLTELLDRHLVTYETELRALQAMTAGPPPPLPPPAATAGPIAALRALFGPGGVSEAAAAAARGVGGTRPGEETERLVHMVDWEADPQTLLDIRSDWDRYLVGPEDPLGSPVPPAWVVPPPPSGGGWTGFLAT